MNRLLVLAVTAALLSVGVAHAAPTTYLERNGNAMFRGGHNLLSLQDADGLLPGAVGSAPTEADQGLAGMGLLVAYKTIGEAAFLDDGAGGGAVAVRDWLIAYHRADTTNVLSTASLIFLAEYAMVTQSALDLDYARAAFDRKTILESDDPTDPDSADMALAILNGPGTPGRKVWEVGLLVRAAHDVGRWSAASRLATVLQHQGIVDPFDRDNEDYVLGLAGIMIGLSEDPVPHPLRADHVVVRQYGRSPDGLLMVNRASNQLYAMQGSCGPEVEDSLPGSAGATGACGDVEATAAAVLGWAAMLVPRGQYPPGCVPTIAAPCLGRQGMHAACRFIRMDQTRPDGKWNPDNEHTDIAGLAIMALSACTLVMSETTAEALVEVAYSQPARVGKTQAVTYRLIECLTDDHAQETPLVVGDLCEHPVIGAQALVPQGPVRYWL